MAGLIILTVVAHLGMAAVDLPALWARQDRRREFWVVTILLLIGLALSIPLVLGYRPVSVYRLIEAIFKPIGTLLFKPEEG